MKNSTSIVAVRFWTLALIFCPLLSAYAEDRLPMWQVDGEQNKIYLLGSIHLLREQDHPLPDEFYAAYEDAETLIMELDMDDIDPVATQAMTTELGLIADGRTLSDWMGPARYAEAEQLAAAAEIPLSMLSRAEPWFAAMNIEMMLLMRLGFNPALGIEADMATRAGADAKEIIGFETMQQQLGFLDGLSVESQIDMLIQGLKESANLDETMDGMIAAWRRGDMQHLEDEMLQEMQKYPELNETIVTNRNRNWLAQIEELTDDEDDYLIVVGALHLIGDEGVPELLEDRGYTVTQMRQN